MRCQQVTPSIRHDRSVADRVLLQETRDYVVRLQDDHARLERSVAQLELAVLVDRCGRPDIFGDDEGARQRLAELLTQRNSREGATLLLQAMDQTDEAERDESADAGQAGQRGGRRRQTKGTLPVRRRTRQNTV